ncbi:MAG: excinuclease ABC subunit UvrC [Deltaproteobacteria bacterium]|nr:excinuclease ABC subunit UvrC [Deltaproteobacteria bacterium]
MNIAQYEVDSGKLRQVLPDGPGAYLFKESSGRVIYVGKAKNLKKRVLSYFRPPEHLSHKTALMMKKANGLDFILTSTEKEAFILERNLIKKFMPRYNVILRDDKQYPCLRLNIKELYPRLSIIRRIKKDGSLYFGPFSSAHSVRSTLKVIDRVFQLRKCKGRGLPKRTRPCLNYQMDRCLGPCTHHVPVSEYRQIVKQVRLFLEGRNRELIERLQKDMAGASELLDFEKAAKIRDQIRAIEKTVERQHVVSPRLEDQDIIGLARDKGRFQVVILFVRKGCVVGNRDYLIKNPGGHASEVMEAFLKQYYAGSAFIPKQVLISEPVEDLLSITEWLCDLAGKKIVIHRPKRGEKLQLVSMAVTNAQSLLKSSAEHEDEDLMDIVRSVFKLKKPPKFIEGLDISNLQGDMAVGSVVSFADGLPHRSGYRNYRIKAVNGIDDYGMMAELVKRRVSKGRLPDLFIVDGGKGHLAAVVKVLDLAATGDAVEVASIAKPDQGRNEKQDKVYLPGRKNPVWLRPDHPALLLMMRIRDEAHRRAISYHRRLRLKNQTASELDLIPGIGAKRKRLLLNHFKDIKSIAKASEDDLYQIPGVSHSLAGKVVLFFQGRG